MLRTSVFASLVVVAGFMLTLPEVASPDGSSRPRVLVPVIGASPAGGQQGATSPASPQQTTSAGSLVPPGQEAAGIKERERQLREDGYDVEVRYFSSLQDFLCWLLEQGEDVYRHVEIYGHGNNQGPLNTDGTNGFNNLNGGNAGGPTIKRQWQLLGWALARVMTNGSGQNGHVLLGWCKSGAPTSSGYGPLHGGTFPAALISGASGKTVFTTPHDIEYPHSPEEDGPEFPVPHDIPFTNPHPDTPRPNPDPPADTPSGWGESKPRVPDEDAPEGEYPPMVPNPGWNQPEPIPEDERPPMLPRAPGTAPAEVGPDGGPVMDPLTNEPKTKPGSDPKQGHPAEPMNPPPALPTDPDPPSNADPLSLDDILGGRGDEAPAMPTNEESGC